MNSWYKYAVDHHENVHPTKICFKVHKGKLYLSLYLDHLVIVTL